MSDRTFQSAETRLAACARDDAERLTPGFSDSLHARVVRAIAAAEFPALKIGPANDRSAARYWISPLALAAAIALVVISPMVPTRKPSVNVVVQSPVGDNIRPPAFPEAHKPQLAVYATAHAMNTRVENVVQTAMSQEQFAGLDHDVRAATRFLVDQVPLHSAWDADPAARGQ